MEIAQYAAALSTLEAAENALDASFEDLYDCDCYEQERRPAPNPATISVLER